ELALAGDLKPDGVATAPVARTTPRMGVGVGTGGDEAIVEKLVQAYRESGHLAAKLDPFDRPRESPDHLDPSFYGLTDTDLDRVVEAGGLGFDAPVPLRDVVQRLKEI